MAAVLGISAFYHDSAACLVVDGEIVAAAQEERFTRKKHDHGFPAHAVRYCLDHAGVRADELTGVGFYDKPILKFDRLLETYLTYAPKGFRSFVMAMPLWMKEKLWITDLIRREIAGMEIPDDRKAAKKRAASYPWKVLYSDHHESHAASAFYPSPFEEAAILTVDGVGEWSTASIGLGQGRDLRLLKELRFPHSLGLLYSAFTYFTGFRVNSGEYKIMGLAPYGEPCYVDLIKKHLVDIRDDGSIWLNPKYFTYSHGLRMTGDAFARLFGGSPRQPESPVTQREMDLARSIQEITEEVMLKMATFAHKLTGQKQLCLAGGVALNCVANGRLLREGPFDDIWIQPASGDAGGALGVAMSLWHRYLGHERSSAERTGAWMSKEAWRARTYETTSAGVSGSGHATVATRTAVMTEQPGRPYADGMRGSLLGPRFSNDQIEDFLRARGLPYRRLDRGALADHVARLLAAEKVIGLFQGRMEFGPRALGGRSIIGDPRSPRMQSVMNLKIKFRESFRPFAPSVLREHVHEWFELDCESPYMLLVADVHRSHRRAMTDSEQQLWGIEKLNVPRSDIPAVTHIDYSARIQTVTRDVFPEYWEILDAFRRATGCPVLVNTSFNVRGEPIVGTPEDAYRCFMRTEIDALVLENCLLEKAAQPAWVDRTDWRAEYQPD
ncbi:MAG: carbamoyltransferase [Vicinamibacterales bacterium]